MFPRVLSAIARLIPVAVVLFSGCAETPIAPEATPGTVPSPPPPRSTPKGIQPGENLDVFVMEDESFGGKFKVRSTGDIIIPQLGRVKLSGLSASAAEKKLASELEKDRLTKATVLVDRTDIMGAEDEMPGIAGTEVFLSGKVNRPGRYSIVGIGNAPPTVHQAILQGGGCSRFAHKSKVHVLRKSRGGLLRRINADLLAIESGSLKDVSLAPGDIIVVPEKMVDFGL